MTAIAEEITRTEPQTTATAISGVVDLGDGRGFLRTAGVPAAPPATSLFPPPRSASTGSARVNHIEGHRGTPSR